MWKLPEGSGGLLLLEPFQRLLLAQERLYESVFLGFSDFQLTLQISLCMSFTPGLVHLQKLLTWTVQSYFIYLLFSSGLGGLVGISMDSGKLEESVQSKHEL